MENLVKNRKWIYLILGVAVVAATLLPLFTISIDIFGNSMSYEFSLRMVIQNRGTSGNDFPLAELGQQLGAGNQAISDLFRDVALPFITYFLAVVLVIIAIIIAIFNKFKMVVNIILVVTVGLMVYSGMAFVSLPSVLSAAIVDLLSVNLLMGLLASMIDITQIVTLDLEIGYWLTFVLIIIFATVKIGLDFLTWNKQAQVRG